MELKFFKNNIYKWIKYHIKQLINTIKMDIALYKLRQQFRYKPKWEWKSQNKANKPTCDCGYELAFDDEYTDMWWCAKCHANYEDYELNSGL
tara:strand:- start:425 stop:700 length:276 start_codon:yes stop_codon:yes gene_type:complete